MKPLQCPAAHILTLLPPSEVWRLGSLLPKDRLLWPSEACADRIDLSIYETGRRASSLCDSFRLRAKCSLSFQQLRRSIVSSLRPEMILTPSARAVLHIMKTLRYAAVSRLRDLEAKGM